MLSFQNLFTKLESQPIPISTHKITITSKTYQPLSGLDGITWNENKI